MKAKIVGLIILQVAVLSLFFLPIQFEAVRIDMPRPSGGAEGLVHAAIAIVAFIAALMAIAAAVLVVFSPTLLAVWLVRKQRRTSE